MKNYIDEALVTASEGFHTENVSPRLLHGVIGAAGETGELLDAVKRSLFYGKPLDRVNLREEIGDTLWYLALICSELDYSFEEAMQQNIAKLRKRYPEKTFSSHRALNRDIPEEQKSFTSN